MVARSGNRRLNREALFADVGYRPHPGQLQVHRSRASRRVVACGVRFGKTLCAAMEGLAAALEPSPRSMGWVVAPTYDLADKVYRELVRVAVEQLPHRVISLRESDRKLLLRNMAGGVSEIRGKSADNPVSLLGEGLDWLIVDEAARLRPTIWQSHLSQRLLDKRGWALLISTPAGKGWFYELFRRGQSADADHEGWNHPSWTNPYLDRALIEQERSRLPERVFAQEYGGQFIEGAGQVFRGVRECAVGQWAKPVAGASYTGGLDLARVQDYTVLVFLDAQHRVVFTDRFHKIDWSAQVSRLSASMYAYGAHTLMDSTGVGDPIYESLAMAGCRVRPYPFTAASKKVLIDNLALMIEQREIVLPQPELWPEGIDELEAFEYSVTESGHVRTSAPSGLHDDCVIALALAAWTSRTTQIPTRLSVLRPRRRGSPRAQRLLRKYLRRGLL